MIGYMCANSQYNRLLPHNESVLSSCEQTSVWEYELCG